MGKLWSDDEVVAPVKSPSLWSEDEVVATVQPKALPRTMTVGEQLTNHPLTKGAIALGEAGLSLGTGALTAMSGGLSGAANVAYNLAKGKDLTDALQSGTKVIEDTTSLAYEPKTPLGKSTTAAALYLPQKAAEGWRQIGGGVGEVLGNRELGETLGGVGMESLMAVAPAPKVLKQARAKAAQLAEPTVESTYPGRQPQAAVTVDQTKVAPMEAAEAAQKHGVAIDLPELDTSVTSRVLRKGVDPEHINAAFMEANKGKPEMALKRAVGIDPETPLGLESIRANLEQLSGPKKEIVSMGGFVADAPAIAEIRALVPERTVGMGAEHSKAVGRVNEIVKDLTEGKGEGSWAMSSIESLRKAARDIYGRNEITPELRNAADIYKGTANAMEGMIERRLAASNPRLLEQYRANREKMAQTYLLEDILDNNTRTVDLNKLANLTKNDDGITGAFKDFGKIYANSPEVFRKMPKEEALTRFSRWTAPGAIGALVGSTVPVVGTLGGAALGTYLGRATSGRIAKKLASPEHQAKYQANKPVPTRADMGYGEVPPPLAIEPQGPLPPSPMGGTVIGTGPRESGVINLAPQLDTGLPQPGPGPGPILRSGRAGPEPVYPSQGPAVPPQQGGAGWQQSGIDIPLTPNKPQIVLEQFYDAMSRGDEAAMARLQAQYDALLAEGQVPNPVHTPLYEAPSFVPRPQPRPFMPDRSGSPFADALRNFKGAE